MDQNKVQACSDIARELRAFMAVLQEKDHRAYTEINRVCGIGIPLADLMQWDEPMLFDLTEATLLELCETRREITRGWKYNAQSKDRTDDNLKLILSQCYCGECENVS